MSRPEEHVVSDASGAWSRKVWLMESPDDASAGRLGIFLDGEFAVSHLGVPAAIDALHQAGWTPSMTWLFVSHVDGAARHRDLTCNPEYAVFIARDVVGWTRGRRPRLAEGGHLIAGPSLGGLAAAFTALTHPRVFARCLSQSGSFWWRQEWLTKQLPALPHSRSRFWLSVGAEETVSGVSHPPTSLRQEVTQLAACERFAAALGEHDHRVHYRVHQGGHDFEAWRDELPDALQWLLA